MRTGFALIAMAVAASGCASTGSTFRSGVADRYLEQAPYYAGVRPPVTMDSVILLPVSYQQGGSHSAMFDPAGAAGTPVAALLSEMNGFLATLHEQGITTRTLSGTPPDVYFGCEVDVTGDCTNGPAAPFDWGDPRMRLAVGRASQPWMTAATELLAKEGASHVIVLTLEVGQYWPRQTNWRGSKAVELGTNHTVGLQWLTSLETPVSVLQLTGVLVGPDGLARRIGAEGLLARRTGIIAAGLGAQALITDEDVEKVRTARRDDLPGNPLVWQEALRTLVARLAGTAIE